MKYMNCVLEAPLEFVEGNAKQIKGAAAQTLQFDDLNMIWLIFDTQPY